MSRAARRPLTHFVLLLAFALGATIATAQDSHEVPSSGNASSATPSETAALQQRLLKLVPSPLPAQAVATAAPAFYSADTLYQYMDGGADIYGLYNLQLMLHQEFRAKDVDVTVDLFDMGSAENAFGMYASERSPDYDFIGIGSEGYRNQGILNFLQGRYYVKLAAFGPTADAVLDQFARALSTGIGGELGFPVLLRQLPTANRKPHSEQYLLKDPLGHSFLGPAYLATYGTNGKDSTLLISVAANETEAKERLRLLTEHFRKSGRCNAAPELGAGAIRASNSFEGNVLAQVQGRYLLVFISAENSSGATLAEALRNLR